MEARERTDTVRAQELLLIEHDREHPAKLGFIEDRGEPRASTTGLEWVVDEGPQMRMALQKLQQTLGKNRVLREQATVKDGDRAQRQEPNHGANFQTLGATIWLPQYIVEEAVLFIPHSRRVVRCANHRGCN